MTTNNINIGQTLFTLGMVLLELPSNMMAKRFGPNRWVPCIMVIWGTVTFCQAFIKNKQGFYATRFLLAAGEAGFIPGMAWYLTRFYVSTELSLRLAIFWSSNSIGELSLTQDAADFKAGMTSGPLALGILSGLKGKNGWHGWQYLFLIGMLQLYRHANNTEGVMTVIIAFIAILYLPNSPVDGGKSLIGHIVLDKRTSEILAHRLLQDDPQKNYARGTTVKWVDIKDTVTDWRLYGHCLAAFASS